DAGYDPDRRSVWVAEGLLFYLTEQHARALVAKAATLATPGSRLLADLITEAALTDPQMRSYHSALRAEGAPWIHAEDHPDAALTESPVGPYPPALRAEGAPWIHAEDHPEEMLAACGWHPDSTLRPGDEGAHFGRWPYPRVEPDTPGAPWSYVMVGSQTH